MPSHDALPVPRGQHDRSADRAPRVPCLFGERRRTLEAAEGEDRVDRARDDSGDAVVAGRRVAGGEHRSGVVAAGVHDEEDREY
jgi:hypothetical protein